MLELSDNANLRSVRSPSTTKTTVQIHKMSAHKKDLETSIWICEGKVTLLVALMFGLWRILLFCRGHVVPSVFMREACLSPQN